MAIKVIKYSAKRAPTLWSFHRDSSFVRGLMGPVGSGKSTACCVEMLNRAMRQKPGPDGKRHSRWLVIRNTYRELQDTTIETALAWWPPDGEYKSGDQEYLWETQGVRFEVLFRSLDKIDDLKKLLSLELTGAWVNEAREIGHPVIKMLQARVGRYPSKREGGPTWCGVIMDTNPPDSDSWWYKRFEEDHPPGWRLFRQPSAMSPEAENLENLPKLYYQRLMAGNDDEWCNVYVHGNYGSSADGKPVHPYFKRHVHVIPDGEVHPRARLVIGVDFGLTPAAVIGVHNEAAGKLVIVDELVTDDMAAVEFGRRLAELLATRYPGMRHTGWGDPAGEQRSQVDEATCFQALQDAGLDINPGPTQDLQLRKTSVDDPMRILAYDGCPRLQIYERCSQLATGLAGKYAFARVGSLVEERYRDTPHKSPHSHVCEALQYLCTGLGWGRADIDAEANASKPEVRRSVRLGRAA